MKVFFFGNVTDLPAQLKKYCTFDEVSDIRYADIMVVCGGDGTMTAGISAVAFAGLWELPILGYNTGHLGFLSNDFRGPAHLAEKFAADHFPKQERSLLIAAVDDIKSGRPDYKLYAINEFAFWPKQLGRLFEVTLEMKNLEGTNKNHNLTFKGDGVIIATTSGSTAHSLSAGGPIVAPFLDAMVITPANPFTLSSRPLVIPANTTIRVPMCENMTLAVDGNIYEPPEDCLITIGTSAQKINIIKYSSFVDSIQSKLGWNNHIKK